MAPLRRSSIVFVAVASLLTACGGDDDAPVASSPADTTADTTAATDPPTTDAPTTSAAATSTTLDPAEAAFAYTEPGPYPVGVTTLQLASGEDVEVWYPAVEGTTGEVTYDVRDFTPDNIKALLTADVPATVTIAGGRDAAAAGDGPFPLVLFSHGAIGFRTQSTLITAHLATWGFVVASTDHPSRDLLNVLGGTSGDRSDAVDDLLATLDLMTAESTGSGLLAGSIDTSKVYGLGHSAGGGTVRLAAEDPRVLGYVTMAAAAVGRPPEAGTTTTLPVLADKPSFWIGGSLDAVADPTRTEASYELAPSPSLLWMIEGVGHQGFSDLCTLGDGAGIIGLARASGLGPFLDSQPQIVTLGADGCEPPALPVTETLPIVQHAVTAWMRWQAGIDAEPIGLGPEVADAYVTPVEIRSK